MTAKRKPSTADLLYLANALQERTDRQLLKAEEMARQLAFALKGLYEDQVDYLKLNNLGGMNNHWMRAARIALADYARTSSVEQPK